MTFGEMTRHDMVILPGAGFPYENSVGQGKRRKKEGNEEYFNEACASDKNNTKSLGSRQQRDARDARKPECFKIRISLRLFRAKPQRSPRKACLYIF